MLYLIHCGRAYFFFFLGIRISLEKKGSQDAIPLEKKNQEIMAALQYKPQPQWKMVKKKYKPRLIMKITMSLQSNFAFRNLQCRIQPDCRGKHWTVMVLLFSSSFRGTCRPKSEGKVLSGKIIPPLNKAASNSTLSTLLVGDKQCGNIQAFLKIKKKCSYSK